MYHKDLSQHHLANPHNIPIPRAGNAGLGTAVLGESSKAHHTSSWVRNTYKLADQSQATASLVYTAELNFSKSFDFKLSSRTTSFRLKSNFKACTMKIPAWILNSKCVETRNLTFVSITPTNFPLFTKQIKKHARNRLGANTHLGKVFMWWFNHL